MKTLSELVSDRKIIVPPYQRAYSWEKEQLKQFVNDLKELLSIKGYYYGHFILEENDGSYEVIDGQQRLTTYYIFKLVCTYLKNEAIPTINFETVDYDQDNFLKIQDNLSEKKVLEQGIDLNQATFSIKRILEGFKYFIACFEENNELSKLDIDRYLEIIEESQISVHFAANKSVASQIFDLHNTRGVNLNLIEKIKSKLMKSVYVKTGSGSSDATISTIQNHFAEIYKIEEMLQNVSFVGKLKVDDILLRHLRMVDDGHKLMTENLNKSIYNNPSSSAKEESIIKYLDEKLNGNDCVEYVLNLVELFKQSVQFLTTELVELDKKNRLIGDVLVLDRDLSIQFFLLIKHKFKDEYKEILNDKGILEKWEKLLFLRDFHEAYYTLKVRDDFQGLYFEISRSSTKDELAKLFDRFIEKSFRPDVLQKGLIYYVKDFVTKHTINIKNNAYHFRKDKIKYLLYKYEISLFNNEHIEELRSIIKTGSSVEHILPREWNLDWIKHEITEMEVQVFKNEINQIINGLGNLLLIKSYENSSLSNKHPSDKFYKDCNGGSYKNHNEKSKETWKDSSNWKTNIDNRTDEIFDFMLSYFIN